MKRILALLLSVAVMCATLLVGMPQADAAVDGMVRVWLKSMDYYGSISSTAITLNGSYSVPANPDVVLSTRGEYTIEVVGGTLMLSGTGINGQVDMGSKFTIKQHLNDDGSIGTISLYNAKYGNRSYRGDMTFDISGGYLRLINRVYIEDYLYGVLAGELSNTFPIETLKAQAVIARSYVYNRMLGSEPNYEINDTSSDQVYKGYNSANTNIIKAVDDTAGVLLKYGSSYVNAYFGASNGGQVELPGNAWSSSSSLGCYVMKDDPYDVRNPSSRSVTYTFTSNPGSLDTAFYTLIQDKVYQKLGYYPTISAIQSVSLSNPVQTDKRSVGISRNYQTMNMTVLVQDNGTGSYWGSGDSNVYDPTYSGGVYDGSASGSGATQSVDITIDLHGELKYTLFSVDSDLRLFSLESSGGYYYLTLARYGHGVGMSQRGAQQMANEGKSYKDIINFYFDGVSLPKLDFTRETLTKYVPMSTTPIATGTVNASSLTVRADASTSGKKLGSLSRGATVDVYADLGEWLCIVYNGSIGYVSASYIQLSNYEGGAATPTTTPDGGNAAGDAVGQAKVTLSTASSTLKLRATASSSGSVLTSMPHGTIVDVLQYGSEWTKVRTPGGTVGYCATRYLTDITAAPGATPTPTPDGGSVTGSACIATDGVALRGSAGGNVIYDYLSKNTPVTVLSEEGGYYCIRIADGTTGYVEKSAVTTTGGATTTTTATATPTPAPAGGSETVVATGTVTGSTVNVRSGPSTTATKIGQLTKDAPVSIISQNSGFYKIKYGAGTGYISASYVKVSGTVETPAATPAPTAAPTPTPTPGTSGETRYVTEDSTKLASAPGSNVIEALLSKNTAVTVLSTADGYCYVRTSGGLTGYVAQSALAAAPETTPDPAGSLPAGQAYINADGTALRAAPGGNVIEEYLARGTAVTVLSTDGSYSYVSTSSGARGYVDKSAVSTATGATPTPTNTPDNGGSTAAQTGAIKLSSSSSSLNLRQGPSTSTAVVTQLKHGASVTVTGESGDWYAITSGGYSGYVMKKYVNIGGSSEESTGGGSSSTFPGVIKLSNASSTVNVRAGAGTNTSKLGTLAHGASVSIVARNGDWYKIEYGTGYGYVLKSYVQLTSGSSGSSSGSSSSSGTTTATTTTSVNLRSTGSTSGTKLGTYPAGTKVTVLSKGSTWSQVSVSGKTGYMKNDYLKFR